MGDFKVGWNTFAVSVANQTLKWHLNKLNSLSVNNTTYNGIVGYFMKTSDNKSTRSVTESQGWGSKNSDEILEVGIPYWVYLSTVGSTNPIPIGWDVYYSTSTSVNPLQEEQWASYGNLYGFSNLPYLKLSRAATYGTNTGYFFELGKGDAYFDSKLHVGYASNSYNLTNSKNDGRGEFKCYVSPNHHFEIMRELTANIGGVQSETLNLNIYDMSGNNNFENTAKINFYNKYNNSNTLANHNLGSINFIGCYNTDYRFGARIMATQETTLPVSGVSTNAALPTSLTFWTGDTTYSTAIEEKMRIDPSGNVSIGKTTTTKKLDVSGQVMIGDKLSFNQQDNTFISSDSNGMIINHNSGSITLEPNSSGVGTGGVKIDSLGNIDIYKSINIGFKNNYLDVSHNSGYLVGTDGHGALTINRAGGTQNRKNEFLRFIGDETTGKPAETSYHFDCSGTTTAGNFTDLHLLFGEGDSMSANCVFKYEPSVATSAPSGGAPGAVPALFTIGDDNTGVPAATATSIGNCNVDIFGNLRCIGGTVSAVSDDRIKHNEKQINNALEVMDKLEPLLYFKTLQFYDSNHDFDLDVSGEPIDENGNKVNYRLEAGFVAQKVKLIDELKSFVLGEEYKHNGNPNHLSISYNDIFVYAVAAIKELNVKDKQKKDKIDYLEKENEEQKMAIQSLENRLMDLANKVNMLEQ